MGSSVLLCPNSTSMSPASRIAIAPTHCINNILSSGTRMVALIIATTTSDMVRIPTRPGNNSWETRKIIQKQGKKITMDQNAAVGKAVFIIVKSGKGSTCRTPAKNAEMNVVAKNIKVANGKMGMFDHRFSVATPIAQNMPDNKL